MPPSDDKGKRRRSDGSDEGSPDRRRRRHSSPDERDRRRRRSASRSRSRGRSRRDRSDSRDRRQRSRSRSRGDRRGGRDRRDDGDARRRRDDDDGGAPPTRAAALPDPAQAAVSGDAPAAAADAAAPAPAPPAGDGAPPSDGAVPAPAAAAVPAAEPPARKAPGTGRTGGVYIPPFKLARMLAEVGDRSSVAYQRMTWDALRKSINGLINKVNTPNMKALLPELFQENLIRGRGLFCQSLMKAQMASPSFSPVYAALVAVVNTKFPELGELLLHRTIAQFRRAYKRNDKPICSAVTTFLAHLINQGVVHELLALEMLILMLENPSDDSVEVAVEFTKEVGAHLQDVAPAGLHSVFERFRAILHEGSIDKRCQYLIEGLFALRKAGFAASGHPAVPAGLDLVDEEDAITHEMGLEERHDPQAALNVFVPDDQFEQHEAEYKAIAREILGDSSEEEEEEDEEGGGGGGADGESEEEEDSEEEGGGGGGGGGGGATQDIQDETQTNLVNLRRTIYLTIMSSMDFEEAGHKLLKIHMLPEQQQEVPIMIIECASQERTYLRYYGLLAARFCQLRREYQATFEQCFAQQYAIIHRLETNKLRNVAKLFAHLLATDAISWGVLSQVRLTEEDTTSSSRIFIKYLFQELSETLGLVLLNKHLQEPALAGYFTGVFPTDSAANMRFAINFFTSIGLGGITDRMRELYRELPKLMAARRAEEEAAARAAAAAAGGGSSLSSSSGSDSSSSDDSSSSSSSGSSSSSSDSSDSSSSSDSESSGAARRRKRRAGGRGDDRRRRSPSPKRERLRRGDSRERGRSRR